MIRIRSDRSIALVLAIVSAIVYGSLFLWMYLSGVAHGMSLAQLITAPDSAGYLSLAHTMLDYHRFALSSLAPADFFRVPGYPFFIAVLLAVFHSLAAIPIAQLVLTAASVSLIYLIGIRHVPRGVAIAAALLYLCEPSVAMQTWLALSESLFMILFLLSLYVAEVRAPRYLAPLAAAGILLGLSALVRPTGLYLAPFIAFVCTARWWPNWRAIVGACAVIIVMAAFTVIPWVIRNDELSGHIGLSSISTFNPFFYNMPDFESYLTGASIASIRDHYSAEVGQTDVETLRSYVYARQESAVVSQQLWAHPFLYAVYHLVESAALFLYTSIGTFVLQLQELGIIASSPPAGALGFIVVNIGRVIVLGERAFWILTCGTAFYTVVRNVERRSKDAAWMVGVLLLIVAFAIVTGPIATPRYRIPLDPLLFLLAAASVPELVARMRRRFGALRPSLQ
jgi:hypothetical protein